MENAFAISRVSKLKAAIKFAVFVLLVAGLAYWVALEAIESRLVYQEPVNAQAVTDQVNESEGQVEGPRLLIPGIGVSAIIENVGVTPEGNMDVPKDPDNVGWYAKGTVPGGIGNSVIAGHLDKAAGGEAAVFWDLNKLRVGDEIYLLTKENKKLKFIVSESSAYNINNAPLDKIFGTTTKRMLNLITCKGSWDVGKNTYSERLVVFAQLAES